MKPVMGVMITGAPPTRGTRARPEGVGDLGEDGRRRLASSSRRRGWSYFRRVPAKYTRSSMRNDEKTVTRPGGGDGGAIDVGTASPEAPSRCALARRSRSERSRTGGGYPSRHTPRRCPRSPPRTRGRRAPCAGRLHHVTNVTFHDVRQSQIQLRDRSARPTAARTFRIPARGRSAGPRSPAPSPTWSRGSPRGGAIRRGAARARGRGSRLRACRPSCRRR